jgi:hypothetical protein
MSLCDANGNNYCRTSPLRQPEGGERTGELTPGWCRAPALPARRSPMLPSKDRDAKRNMLDIAADYDKLAEQWSRECWEQRSCP